MSPREIYQSLCEASNLDAAVLALTNEQLTAAAQYVAGLKPRGGLPAQVWGVISKALDAAPRPSRSKRTHTKT